MDLEDPNLESQISGVAETMLMTMVNGDTGTVSSSLAVCFKRCESVG